MTRAVVIFDVDGTLVDSQAHIMAAMESAFQTCGLPTPSRARVLSQIGRSLDLLMAELAGPEAAPALADAYRASFARKRRGTVASPLYPGTARMLADLAARDDLLLAVATGKSRRGLAHLIDSHGWQGLFASLQTADDHPSKPHPSMIHAILDDTGIPASRAAMVGDTSYDMDMARAARVPGIAVPWGYHDVAGLGADAALTGWGDLPGLLNQLWEGAP